MKAATCFSGIGAPEEGGPQFEWLWHAEVEQFPCAVMAARHPESANLGDVLAPDFIDRAKAFGPLDLLAGGPPCQAFSVAGLRQSMGDARGNLSLRWVEILHGIAPRNAITENVPGWLNTPDNAFGCFLGAVIGADDALHSPLDEGRWPSAGMVAGPRARCAWRVLDAQHFGVAQRRRRVFVVTDFGNGADPAEILFERKGVQGHPATSRETGQGIAGTLAARAGGGGYPDGGDGRHSHLVPEVVGTLSDGAHNGGGLSGQDAYSGRIIPVAHSLRGEGFDASEDGTGRGTPLVPVQQAYSIMPMNSGKDFKARETDIAQPIMAGGPVGGNQGGDYIATIQERAVSENPNSGPDGAGWRDDGKAYTLEARSVPQAAAFSTSGNCGAWETGDRTDALDTNTDPNSRILAFNLRGRDDGAQPETDVEAVVANQSAVRRLTPRECERLQGFPDDFTLIPYGRKTKYVGDDDHVHGDNIQITYKGQKPAADGPRYKALGNSWAVPCGAWIIGRIADALARLDAERAAA